MEMSEEQAIHGPHGGKPPDMAPAFSASAQYKTMS